jgi:hypothetical protein
MSNHEGETWGKFNDFAKASESKIYFGQAKEKLQMM